LQFPFGQKIPFQNKARMWGGLQTYTLACTQVVPPTPGQPTKLPMVIPMAVGLLGPDGADMPLTMGGQALGTTTVLKMDQASQTFVFDGVQTKPVPSLLRNLSAPVKLIANQVRGCVGCWVGQTCVDGSVAGCCSSQSARYQCLCIQR
jgi:hypothetical protein